MSAAIASSRSRRYWRRRSSCSRLPRRAVSLQIFFSCSCCSALRLSSVVSQPAGPDGRLVGSGAAGWITRGPTTIPAPNAMTKPTISNNFVMALPPLPVRQVVGHPLRDLHEVGIGLPLRLGRGHDCHGLPDAGAHRGGGGRLRRVGQERTDEQRGGGGGEPAGDPH